MTDAREELEEAIDAVINAAVAVETASMRRELDALNSWMRAEVQKLQAREAYMLERLHAMMEVAQAEVDDAAAPRTLN
jgi:hypothetical protein